MTDSPATSARAFTERAVTFARGAERLTGVLALPDAGARGACLVLHGWGSNRTGPHRVLVDLARALAGGGVAALRFDHAGRGDSTGAFLEADLDTMIDDALAAAAFLRGETSAERLSGFGLCSGGNIALGAAALEPCFERLVCVSTLPFQGQRTRAADRARCAGRAAHLARRLLSPRAWGRVLRAPARLGAALRYLFARERGAAVRTTPEGEMRNLKASRRDLVAALGRWRGRALFLYGGADREGEAGWSDAWAPLAHENGLAMERSTIEGANHNFYGLPWREALIESAVRFLCGTRSVVKGNGFSDGGGGPSGCA